MVQRVTKENQMFNLTDTQWFNIRTMVAKATNSAKLMNTMHTHYDAQKIADPVKWKGY